MPSQVKTVEIYSDKEMLSMAAANKILTIANLAIKKLGFFTIAIAGGSTPKRLYELLASDKYNTQTEWSKWHVFLGDERMVPDDSPDSNYGEAYKALLSKVPMSQANIHSVKTNLGNLAAEDYEHTISNALDLLGASGLDIIMLGLGSDCHTLSLFPGKISLTEKSKWIVATSAGTLPPPVDRITMTLPAVQAAKLALFLVAGPDKALAVKDTIEGSPDIKRPASLVTPSDTLSVCWMLDQAASANLTQSPK